MPADTAVAPAHLWVPPYDRTDGDIAAEIGEQVGLVPDPDQRMILDAIFAVRDDKPACFEAAVIASRQNIKTSTLEIAALTDLFVFEVPLHLWTAHLFKTAVSAFEDMVRLIEANDDFRRRCRKPRTANGDEAIELLTGQRIEFHARSKGGGRGLTGTKVTLDEALFLAPPEMGALLPTMATKRDAQIRYGSSAGLAQSGVLRGVRNRGRAGGDPSLAWIEWCAERADCETPFCHHFVGTPGCALDRRDLWAASNPALGRRITVEALEQFRRAMPPEEFAREFLGWWEDPPDDDGGAIADEAWSACLDRESRFGDGPVSLGLHLTGDRTTAYVAGVGAREDGLVHAELLAETRPSRVVDEILALVAKRRAPVVIDPGSHAGSLIQPLEDAGVEVEQITLQKLAAACGQVYDLVTEKQLRHIGQAQLDAAVAGASTRVLSRDAWLWKGAAVTPLVAVTLAAHGHAIAGTSDGFNIW
jgi:hypothetical protein